ncbi:MAG: glycosyltransferase family 87 protein [Anaerolineae bacterium]
MTSFAKRLVAPPRELLGSHWLVWALIVACALALHVGTAVLRMPTFFPSPQLLDFASYYAGAWSLRLGLTGAGQWQSVVSYLAINEQLYLSPPAPYGPTAWQILLLPVTLLPYPAAAALWLALLVALCVWAHAKMMRVAGVSRARYVWLTLPLTLTFGPAFLNFTLGQSAPVLLVCVLVLGAAPRTRASTPKGALAIFPAILCWIAAIAAKLFPAVWLAPWLLARRWRDSAIALLVCFAAFGAAYLAQPVADREYWRELLPGRALLHATSPGIDDQSLAGFVGRLSRPSSYQVPGMSVEELREIVWEVPWRVPAWASTGLSIATLGLLGAVAAVFAWRSSESCPLRSVLLVVLYTLMLVPHMERYNHIVALPAIAWLLGRGLAGRRVAVAAYGLFALSRLNHLWVQFPFPFGPLASGFGLLAVLLLFVAMVKDLDPLTVD